MNDEPKVPVPPAETAATPQSNVKEVEGDGGGAEQPLNWEEPIKAADLDTALDKIEEAATAEIEQQLKTIRDANTMPEVTSGGAPGWVKIPPDSEWVFPRSRTIYFLRFRAEWTDTPHKGERQCICWNITVGDKKLAAQRAMGDGNRITEEMTMRFIRAIDGHKVDHTGKASEGNAEVWWNEIGERCRSQIMRIFMRAHSLDEKEQADFLTNCVAVRTAGG